jgi:hypothetical protein
MANHNSINNRTYVLTSDTGVTSTTGNITATAGNLVSTLGDVVITNGKLTLGASNGTNGMVPVASTGNNPAWAAITAAAGSGITVTLGANTIALASTNPFLWAAAAADAGLVNNNGYINTKAALLTMTLPATAAVGTVIKVMGSTTGATGWKIAQNANQYIWTGNVKSTTGVGGSIASSDVHDAVCLVCVVADLAWNAYSVVGNITIV